MRLPFRISCSLAALAVFALISPLVPVAGAVTHVVISEFATRGPSNATEEFVELYNPGESAVDIGGWRFQYKQASGGAFADRAVFPANTSIAAHGFFLITNSAYASPPVVPDYSSGIWGSGQGMADNGNIRILDAALVEVDRVGFGTGDSPEGTDAPNHGTSANSNSVERKAKAVSTADSMAAGGLHALLGNGQDTNVNGSDFVVQTHGRNMQNSSSSPEPAFSAGGNGTGKTTITPTLVFSEQVVDTVKIVVQQDSAYTLTKIAILVPPEWTWAHSTASVVLSGTAFQSATVALVSDTLIIDQAAVTTVNSGTVAIADLTAPTTKGNSTFTTRTAVSAGTLTPILVHPKIRVLERVPIIAVHVNDASGVATSPYGVGAEATVTGIVTANLNSTRTDVYVQDGTAGIDVFNAALPPFTIQVGDSVTVTGSILQFRGLTELQPDFALLTLHASGRPVPDPMLVTCAEVNATFKPDHSEPNEGRLVRVNGVSYNSVTSTITDATGTTNIFIPSSFPPAPSVFDVIGILKQFKPGTPAPGPPYTADYEISPRTPDDIIPHPGPILLTTPYEDNLQPTSVEIHWTTDVASTSIVRYGLTPSFGDSVVDNTPVTSHTVTLSGLTPATVYDYSAGSGDVNGSNFSITLLFSTASPAQSTGVINVYFNKSVNTSLATFHAANGNQDLAARLVPHINNAQRSIDAAMYNLSGTSGTALATALINAKNRGVKVRVICEYDNLNATFTSISSAGIPLINDRFDSNNNGLGLMHNKFMVIDGRGGAPESTWVWTGSWNPTDPGTNDDFQNSIEVQDQALAGAYLLEFNEMWGSSTDTPNAAASRFGAHKLDNTPHRFRIGGRDVECYFSPSDGVTGKIIDAMDAAQHSIAFELLTLTRSDISAALIARKVAGLAVRGDLDNNTDSGSEYATLVSNGIDVHIKTGVSGLLHHKYCLFDAENPAWNGVTLTGSHNWSSAAENSNNENTLVVHDADITNQYLQEMAARYYQFGGTDSIHVTAVDPIGGFTPGTVALAQNFPNPFTGRTRIAYALPTREQVVLRLFDVSGREVRTLVNQVQAAGTYRVDFHTGALASGVYFYRLEAGRQVQQRKLLLLR